MGGSRRRRSQSRRGRADRHRSRRRGERSRERRTRSEERRRDKEKIAALEHKLQDHNRRLRAGRQQQEEGWEVSKGGGAGKAGRNRRGQARAGPTAALAEDDRRYPEWECGCCYAWNWATRRACRLCNGPREAGATRAEMEAGAARARRATPATGANATPIGPRPPAAGGGAGASPPPAGPVPGQAAADPRDTATTATTGAAQQRGTPAGPEGARTSAEGASGTGKAGDAQADKQQAAAVRAKEHKRLARLDAALLELDEDDLDAAEALRRARRQCAERIAGTQPLGRRLADAKKAHARASAELSAAEEAAAAAARRAEQALEAEHTWAAKVEDLQRQVDSMQSRPLPEPALATAREFMAEMHQWLAGLGMAPPPSVQEAADRLRCCLPEDAPGDASSPTDLAAPTTPVPGAEDGAWEEEDAAMAGPGKRRAGAEGQDLGRDQAPTDAAGRDAPPARRPRLDNRSSSA